MNAIYVRQSVDRVDSISIESQVEHCLYEVKKEEYTVYKDKGYSGKNVERPDFQTMMEHIKQGIIKRVIIYKLDRISRSLLDFTRIMQTFEEYNVEFVSATEKFDTSTPTGRAMLKVCMVFAELERETIQARVIDAYLARSRQSFYMGGRIPYGFKQEPYIINGINTSWYAPVQEEIEHMQIIYGEYAKPSMSLSDVIKYLRDNKIRKKRNNEWVTGRLSETMENPIYVRADIDIYNFFLSRGTEIVNPPESFIGENGCYVYKKADAIGKKKDMSRYDQLALVIAPHKGVVDSETWIKCRLKLEQNRQIPNRRKSYRTWVSGKLKCGKCGYALRYNAWKGVTVTNEYYICSEVTGNRRCDGFGAVRKTVIEAAVLEQVQAKINELEVEQSQPVGNQAEINTVKISIADKENEINELIDKFEGGSDAVMRRLNSRVEALEDEILGLKQELLRLEMSNSSKKQLDVGFISQVFELWDKVPNEEKQAIADILIKRVKVTKEIIEIEWKV